MSRSIGRNEIERFIAIKRDVNALMSDGNTALYHALLLNNKALTKILLDRGADIYVQNSRGITPLDLALHPSHITESGILVVYSYMQRDDFNPDAIIAGTTLLQILLYHGTIELVKDLLTRGARCDIPNIEGETALDFAVKWHNHATKKLTDKGIEIIKKHLSQESVDVNAKLLKGGRTLLHAIIEKNSDDMLQLLLSKGASYDIQDSEGKNALDLVLSQQSEGKISESGRILLKFKAQKDVLASASASASAVSASELLATEEDDDGEDLAQADATNPSATVISPAIPVPDAAVPSAEAAASVEIAGDHQE